MKKKIKFKFSILFLLILISFLARLIAILFYGDTRIDNEWGILLNNLYNYKTYAFYEFGNKLIPSSYMPPLYPFILLFLKIASFNKINILNLIFTFQILLSLISIYIFYKINEQFFSIKTSIISSFIFSFLPLNIYAVTQTSSITLQIFLSLLFLRYFFLTTTNTSNKNILIFSIICGLSLLTRGEFILILIPTLIYQLIFKKINILNLIKILLISFIIVSPYLVRNYINFEKIHIANVTGYALWKGNNPSLKVEGFENFNKFEDIKSKLENIPYDNFYETKRDNIFFKAAIKNILGEPDVYLLLYIKKIFSFYFFDINSTYKNYYHFMHIVPIALISILSLPGLVIFLRSKDFHQRYLTIYLVIYILIFSLFFILPRYKLAILPIQIILSTFSINYLLNKMTLKIKKIIN
jgi:4-amino-4-deoxy-L-arabinose transferase-like glycosyltransferase